jgi:hypothetical protein
MDPPELFRAAHYQTTWCSIPEDSHIHANDVNLSGESKHHEQEHKLSTTRWYEVGLKANTQKTEYTFLSHHQTIGKNCNIQTANKSFEYVARFTRL